MHSKSSSVFFAAIEASTFQLKAYYVGHADQYLNQLMAVLIQAEGLAVHFPSYVVPVAALVGAVAGFVHLAVAIWNLTVHVARRVAPGVRCLVRKLHRKS